ncbi:hypothetical protein OKW43_004605 [Paraburkholderia sp. WC7.3g]|uniref:hypothetical protein n=1 Tax=Paraburkholderia sp. WC7.3g TaxID=2991070 RepID=UPI003D241F76
MTNEFFNKNSQYLETDENEEWTEVGTAITNTTLGSISNVVIKNHRDIAIRNADNITGYIATFDGRNIR